MPHAWLCHSQVEPACVKARGDRRCALVEPTQLNVVVVGVRLGVQA
jgi:hypothetical protein